MVEHLSWQLLLFPVIGAVIGAVTNQIAIKMLFRPYAPVRILGWRNKLVVDLSRLTREFAADPDAVINGEAAPIAKAPNQVDYRVRAVVQLVF